MLSKNNKYLKQTKEGTKVESYSIKKFKVGAASVVVGASIFFGAGVAAASEDVANNTTADNTTNAASEEAPKAVAVETTAVEAPKQATTEEVAAAVAEKEVAEADKTTLEKNIKKLEESLNAVDSSKAPASTLAAAKVQLENAKEVIENKNATQEEVDAAAKKVSEQNFVISSMPKAGAEEKEVKEGANSIQNTGSHDPRNGQSMGEGVALRADNPGTSTGDTTNNGTHIVTTNDNVAIDQETKHAIDKLKLGEGVGVLVDKTQTVSPNMQDPNGAKLEDPKSSMPDTTPTSNNDYHTFGYFGLHWLDFAGVDKQLPKDYYMRASSNKDDSKSEILLEMVRFSDQEVLETHVIDKTQVADFTSLQKYGTHAYTKAYPIKALYDTTARDESKNIAGQVILYFAQIAGGWSMGSYNIPMNSAYVTKYVTDDGKLLATYSIKGSSKQMSTPSDVREFSGYKFKETQVSGSPKLNVYNIDAPELDAKNYQYKRLLEMVKADGTAVKSLWVVDPTLSEAEKAKLNFADESTDGFIKVLETSPMEPGGVNENIKVITGQKLSDGTTLISEEEAAEIEKKAGDNDGVNFGTNNTVTIWQDPNDDKRYIRLGFVGNYSNVRPYGVTTPGKSAYMQTTWAKQTNFKLVPLENDALYVPTILHVYTKAGDVVVKYVDQDGNEISGTGLTSVDATTGTTIPAGGQTAVEKTTLSDNNPISYNTATEKLKPAVIKDAKGNIYYLVGVEADKSVYDNNTTKTTEDDVKVGETGTVQQGTTTVTYKYEKAGNVTINYISTDGTVLQTPVKDVVNGKPGTSYDTTENSDSKEERPTVISTGGKVYRLVQTSGTTTTKVTYDANGVATGEGYSATTGTVEAGVDKNVTYVYEEVKFGDVDVAYINTKGEKIADTENVISGYEVGSEYTTTPKETITVNNADGTTTTYRLVKKAGTTTNGVTYDANGVATGKDNAPATGDVTETKQTVTYVYEEVVGSVEVKYIDEAGNPISGTTTGIAKTTVDSTEKDVDAKGNEVTNVAVGTKYDTTDLRPETITTAKGKVYKLLPKLTKGNETGDVVEGTTTITYVYQEVKGNVEVNYVDENNNPIAGTTTGIAKQKVESVEKHVTDASNGTSYDTSDLRPETITTADGTVYYLVGIQKGSAAESGEDAKVVAGETKKVTYVYQKAGSVTINYIATDGTVIKTPVKDVENGKPGESYNAAEKDETKGTDERPTTITTADGKTYKLVTVAGTTTTGVSYGNNGVATGEGHAPISGLIESGKDLQVTYVYEEVKGNVIVKYYDEAGKEIAEETKAYIDASTGTDYETAPIEKITAEDGTVYYYKEVKSDSDAPKGKVEKETTTVKYVYEKAGSVVVNYVDEKGNVIKAQEKPTAYTNVKGGTDYDTTKELRPETITTADGKTYKLVEKNNGLHEGSAAESGKVTSGQTTEVTYVYQEVQTPTTDVVTNFVEKGTRNVLAPQEKGKQDPKVIDGYKLVGTEVDPKGNITHIYEKAATPTEEKGNVVVHYVVKNADGTTTELQKDYNDLTNAPVGTKYNTAENETEKPTTITKDGKTYKLVTVVGNETGEVVVGTTEVTYVYEEVQTPTTDVVTNFVEKGTRNVLAPQEKGKQDPKAIDGYKLVGTEVDPKGNVTHIYEKAATPVTQKVTKYIEEGTGTVLSPEENGKQNPKEISGYELVRTYTDENGNTVHVYKKVTNPVTQKVTKFVDENGNPVANEEKGNQPKKEVNGYEFVRTYTDENGNTVHVYKKVTNPTPTPTVDKHTSYVDVDGNEIRPTEEGTQPMKDITGYEFVETKVDEKGNTVHVYRKVVTPTPVNPVTPEQPSKPTVVKEGKQLPNTDATSNSAAAGVGLIGMVAAAIAARRRKNK